MIKSIDMAPRWGKIWLAALACLVSTGLARPMAKPSSFLEYCLSENKSAEEQKTMKIMAKELGPGDCEEQAKVAEGLRQVYIVDDITDVRVLNYLPALERLTIISFTPLRLEQLGPSDKLKYVNFEAPVAKLPFLGPNVRRVALSYTGGVNFDVLDQYKNLRSLWLDEVQAEGDWTVLRQLTKLRFLTIIRSNFRSLEHIPVAPGLKSLELTANGLTTLEGLPSLANLKFLAVAQNPITHIAPITTISAIEDLDISGTKIEDIETLSQLPKLKKLEANNTGIKNWQSIEQMPALRTLMVKGNGLDDEALSLLVNDKTPLLKLDISDNAITDLAPTLWFDRISTIVVERNQLAHLGELPETLWSLEADHNQIADLSGFRAKSLWSMSLNHNQLKDPTGLDHDTNLSKVSLRNNRIESLMPMKNFCCARDMALGDNPLGTTIDKTPENCPADAKAEGIRKFCEN